MSRYTLRCALLLAGLALLTLASSSAHAQYTIQGLGNFGTDSNGKSFSTAIGINNLGQVVGYSNVYNANGNNLGSAAFLYTGGQFINLGNFGTDANGIGFSDAFAVNASGQVAGYSDVYDSLHNYQGDAAFLYTNGQLLDLGYLSKSKYGVGNSEAYGLNDSGQVVGWANVYDSLHNYQGEAAFLYTNGQFLNLNSLLPPNSGWNLTAANGINDKGQIVGAGTFNGQTEAFLMTPMKTLLPPQSTGNPIRSLPPPPQHKPGVPRH